MNLKKIYKNYLEILDMELELEMATDWNTLK